MEKPKPPKVSEDMLSNLIYEHFEIRRKMLGVLIDSAKRIGENQAMRLLTGVYLILQGNKGDDAHFEDLKRLDSLMGEIIDKMDLNVSDLLRKLEP